MRLADDRKQGFGRVSEIYLQDYDKYPYALYLALHKTRCAVLRAASDVLPALGCANFCQAVH
jgi:hypothetical protein